MEVTLTEWPLMGQFQTSDRVWVRSDPSIVLQNSQNALLSISRKLTKRAAIADRCRLQAIAEVVCEFIADYVVPQMIIRSPRVQPGKLLLVDTKGLLQHYPFDSGHGTCGAYTRMSVWCQQRKSAALFDDLVGEL
jgi:hypothetical protein